jgi:hypothetical protein
MCQSRLHSHTHSHPNQITKCGYHNSVRAALRPPSHDRLPSAAARADIRVTRISTSFKLPRIHLGLIASAAKASRHSVVTKVRELCLHTALMLDQGSETGLPFDQGAQTAAAYVSIASKHFTPRVAGTGTRSRCLRMNHGSVHRAHRLGGKVVFAGRACEDRGPLAHGPSTVGDRCGR